MSEANADNGVATELERGQKWAVERLSEVDKQVRALLTEHPIAALACAVGIGFIVGRLLTSRGNSRDR
jgi:ElaB/YqjD/DUF883 family membrane-anchored ribosome-binding protein